MGTSYHQADDNTIPHVLIFPLPIQSAVNTMLKLAEILCGAGVPVTFLNTHHNQQSLLRHTNIGSRFKQYSAFQFETIFDGLPEDSSRSAEQFGEMLESLQSTAEPYFRERLGSNAKPPVTCVIAEALLVYVADVAREFGVPVIPYETIAPSCLWVYFCIPRMAEAGELPSAGNDSNAMVTSVPGMEGILRVRDLPYFGPGDYINHPNCQAVLLEVQRLPRAIGVIVNTFEDLDGPYLSHLRALCPNLYAVGPLHQHLKTKLSLEPTSSVNYSNSLLEEDRSCIKWLDAQPSKSVIYASVGSLHVMTKIELMEVWHGLVNSGVKFLWVIRLNSVPGEKLDPEFLQELAEGSEKRGYIVTWAPQEEVLAHPAIGGFLSHGGWGSILESIVESVPMICWPHYVDQQVSSRLVSEVWKMGLDMKDVCDRVVVEAMVKELMETRKEEFQESARNMSELARRSVSQGGSSYGDLERLINDIKQASIQCKLKV